MKLPRLFLLVNQVYTNLSKKEKQFLFCAAIVVLIFFIDAVIVRPFLRKTASLDTQIAQVTKQIKSDLVLLFYEQRIHQQRARYSSYLISATSDNEEFAAILKEIETQANKAAINIQDIKPSGVRQQEMIKKFIVNVVCEGSMDKIFTFIYSIEENPRLLLVEKYELTPKSKDTDIIKATMTITKLAFQ